MEFYFTDRQFNVLGIASTDGSGLIKMIDDHEIMEYESDDLITLSGTLVFGDSQSKLNKVKNMVSLGNYIIYRRYNGTSACLSIMEYNHNPINGERSFKAEDAGLDLLNNVVPTVNVESPQSFDYYYNITMADTGITLRNNIFANTTRTLVYDNESTALERLRANIADFGGGKFLLDFQFQGTKLVGKYIDIVEDVGVDRPVKLRVGKDVGSITTDANIYDLVTAVRPFGGKLEGSDSKVNLVGFEWSDPDSRFKLVNGLLTDTQEAPKWSRLLSTSTGLFTRAITFDTTDKGKLVSLAVQHLKDNSNPAVNYTVNVVNPDVGFDIGDRVDVVDEFDELYINGKVLTIDRSTTNGTIEVILGDFRIVYDGLDKQLVQIANDFSKQFDESIPSQVIVTPSKQFFVNGEGTITLSARVTKGDKDISDLFTQYNWRRYDGSGALDPTFNQKGRTITITAGSSAVYTYKCLVDY